MKDFDKRAKSYEQDSAWVRNPEICVTCIDLLGRSASLGNVFDFGGGSGYLARLIKDHCKCEDVIVVDSSIEMLGLVPDGLHRVRSRIEDFYPQIAVNTAIVRQVLHYLERPEDILKKINELMPKGSVLYVGQIVAPSEHSSFWLQECAIKLSSSRRRVWDLSNFILFLQSQSHFVLDEMRVHRFEDSCASWSSRAINSVDSSHYIVDARMRLTRTITSDLVVVDIGNDLIFHPMFVHVKLVKK